MPFRIRNLVFGQLRVRCTRSASLPPAQNGPSGSRSRRQRARCRDPAAQACYAANRDIGGLSIAPGKANGIAIVLRVRNLTKTYRTASETVAVLRGVNLDVASGERVALTGESGSGKSTLLHLIAGLDSADGGEIILQDACVTALNDAARAMLRRDQLGLVFQQFNLIPSLNVADNLAFQARIAGRFDAAWQDELVERLGLSDLLKRYPEQLSGGQQQRVAIGRALAPKPLLLLADEPTGNLDEDTADDVLRLARDLVARSGCGFLMVTHSLRLAGTLDRQVTLHAGLVT
jgi:putative ABC transport system ATP-binding protein